MSQFISKSLMVILLLALADGPDAVAQESSPPQAVPTDPVCYDYYLKMHDIEFGTREYTTQRDKRLEFKCGAFRRADPKK